MSVGPMTICFCGHARRVHTADVCGACACNRFAQADDVTAAILAGAQRKRAAVDAANTQRRTYYGGGTT